MNDLCKSIQSDVAKKLQKKECSSVVIGFSNDLMLRFIAKLYIYTYI